MPDGVPWFVAIVGALLGAGGVTALLQSRSVNRRTLAEADKSEADAQVTLGTGWQLLVSEQRKELNELRERLAIVERSEEACQQRLAQLEAHASPEKIEAKVSSLLDAKIAAREERTA